MSSNWSDYWAQGALHSCVGSFKGNYGGAIAAFWNEVFVGLKPGARVLDVATGNGALPALLMAARDANVTCEAIDLATIKPPFAILSEWRERLVFRSQIDSSALPYSDSKFDLCISQYGIEYAGLGAAREVSRVLKPGGEIALVVHHIHSLPVRIAQEEARHGSFLLAPDGLFACAAAMLEPLSVLGQPGGAERLRGNAKAERARNRFNQAMQALELRAASSGTPDLLHEQQAQIGELCRATPRLGMMAANLRLKAIRAALDAHLARQVDLVSAAKTAEGLAQLVEACGCATTSVEALHVDGALFGWAVLGRKH